MHDTEEDGTLRWCGGECVAETPHKLVKVEDRTRWECEFCGHRETHVFTIPISRFDLLPE